MKKMVYAFLLVFCVLFSLQRCDTRSKKAKLAHNAMYKTLTILENRYQLEYIGRSETADENHYNSIGLTFRIFRVLSKEEGRKMLINCVEELLKEINSDTALLQFLEPKPFTFANIKIFIIAYQPDGKSLFYPNITFFSVSNGKMYYATKSPEKEYGFYTKETESYKEALQIVQSQANAFNEI